MSIIKMDTAEINRKGDNLIQCSEAINQSVEQVGQIKNQMMEVWEGNASKAFEEFYNEMKPKLDEFVKLVCNMGMQTKKSAEKMKNADQHVAGQIRSKG